MSDLQSLGQKLRDARESHELSLPDLEKKTRIRPRFLQAMENGQFQVIENQLQLKGFLRSYAKAVGLDEDNVLNEYEAALYADSKQRRRRRRQAPPQTPPPPAPNQTVIVTRAPASTQERQPDPALYRPERRSTPQLIIAIGLLLGVVAMIAGGAFLIIRDLSTDDSSSEQILQPVNVGGGVEAQPRISPTPFVAPTQVQLPDINPGELISVQLIARQRLWLQLSVDEVVVFEGILRPGDVYPPINNVSSVVINTTNAGGLEVLVNNQPYTLGANRQAVVRRLPDDILAGTTSSLPEVATNTEATEVVAVPSQDTSDNSAKFSSPAVEATSEVVAQPTLSLTPSPTLPGDVAATSTLIPTLGFASDTPTATPSPIPPTLTPTFTASPFLPERNTRTPTLDKS